MAQSMTTSIRLPRSLRAQLERNARALHRGKNWIIIHALEAYFEKQHLSSLAEEARRQSLLVSQSSQDDHWEDDADTTGWK